MARGYPKRGFARAGVLVAARPRCDLCGDSEPLTKGLNNFPINPISQVAKKILEPDQKGPRCEAREESESEGV